MKRFKTFDELRQFVKNGGDVYWQTNNYAVVYMFDDLRITAGNGGSIGIYEPDFDIKDFYAI